MIRLRFLFDIGIDLLMIVPSLVMFIFFLYTYDIKKIMNKWFELFHTFYFFAPLFKKMNFFHHCQEENTNWEIFFRMLKKNLLVFN